MRNLRIVLWLTGLLAVFCASPARAADEPSSTRKQDVIYGRKGGVVLTMDVFTPKQSPSGAAVIFAVSGGWFSAHEAINPLFYDELLKRGYTVFAVVHGSQPKYVIPEILQDMHRAVRYIRHNAKEFGIDPNRIGITGASAGGHLSLMQGTAGDLGDPKAKDPVDRESSRVHAVACFFPPTDFLNYGETGKTLLGNDTAKGIRAPFDFQEFDEKTRAFVLIVDQEKRIEIGRQLSPAYHVSADDPPTFIMHGDADPLVPLQQSQLIIEKLKEAQVPCELVVKPGGAHPWPDIGEDIPTLADWFDKYLAKK